MSIYILVFCWTDVDHCFLPLNFVSMLVNFSNLCPRGTSIFGLAGLYAHCNSNSCDIILIFFVINFVGKDLRMQLHLNSILLWLISSRFWCKFLAISLTSMVYMLSLLMKVNLSLLSEHVRAWWLWALHTCNVLLAMGIWSLSFFKWWSLTSCWCLENLNSLKSVPAFYVFSTPPLFGIVSVSPTNNAVTTNPMTLF